MELTWTDVEIDRVVRIMRLLGLTDQNEYTEAAIKYLAQGVRDQTQKEALTHGTGYNIWKGRYDTMRKDYEELVTELNRLSKELAEHKETLEFAAQYKGFEGRSCPLCKYEDGVFIERCQMHADMDILRYAVTGLITERDNIANQHAGLVLENQKQKDFEKENESLKARIKDLEKQLRKKQHNEMVWIPLKDAIHSWENSVGDRELILKIENSGQNITQWEDRMSGDGDEISFGYQNYRVCELVYQKEEDSPLNSTEALISNEQLDDLVRRVGGLTDASYNTIFENLVYVRGTYERKLAEYEPVPDGIYEDGIGDLIEISHSSDGEIDLAIDYHGKYENCRLLPDWKLIRKRDTDAQTVDSD